MAAAFATLYSGLGALFRADARRAGELFDDCQAICEAHGEQWLLGYCLINAVPTALGQEDLARRVDLVRTCVPVHRRFNDTLSLTLALDYLSWAAAADGNYRRAATLLGVADQQWNERGGSPLAAGETLNAHQRCLATSREALGEAVFAAAYQRGTELTLDQAVTHALDIGEDAAAAVHPAPSPGEPALTRRERQIAALVAQGLTNKQIAARLVISRRTAEGHVENVLAKMGFTSRSQIAAWHARISDPDS
jgi:DNA-binding CsgD family transcriptional regulator